ncbi:BlaR1 family beta-lactam sensor/signal transducer [Lacrimispora sp. BS-2]|uniref:BlaR1 family beta-lactam sensor/signal transducer n=1 Tax=Lacrimispora sp. BS-2 TaxID=3151850 RepID=A0AAU7PMX2_9FIRM
MFAINFIKCNIILTCIIGIVYFLVYIFKKYLSPGFHYNLGLVMLITLLLPFIPLHNTNANIFESYFESGESQERLLQGERHNASEDNLNLLSDNSEGMSQMNWKFIGNLLLLIWILGMIYTFFKAGYTNYKIYLLNKYALPNQNASINQLLEQCLKEMGINKKIPLKIASLNTPGIVGIINPCILLPRHTLEAIPLSDLRFIILHELQHYRHKDILINCFICLIQILYWFNPAINWFLKELRQVQEVSCDTSVLSKIESHAYSDYGNALINFAELVSKQTFSAIYNIGGSYQQIRRRSLAIVHYKKYTSFHRLKDFILVSCVAAFIFCITPSVNLLAATHDTASLKELNYKTVDLSSYFSGYAGSFVLYNVQNDTYSLYNADKCVVRTSPDSTYKIYSALAALENHIITPGSNVQAWSGEHYSHNNWNQNQTLKSAMAKSVNWYFQNLDVNVGYSRLQSFFDMISYGNKDLSGGISNYWIESSLLISPLEQVQLLTDFQKNTWGFDTQNVAAVKNSIFISDSQGNKLFGKTGTGNVNGKFINGWFVGYVETSSTTYVFASNIQGTDHCDGATAAKISLNILSDLKIY